jgi:hypothetical protein
MTDDDHVPTGISRLGARKAREWIASIFTAVSAERPNEHSGKRFVQLPGTQQYPEFTVRAQGAQGTCAHLGAANRVDIELA